MQFVSYIPQTIIYDSEIFVRASEFLSGEKSDSDTLDEAIAYAKDSHVNRLLIDTKDWYIDRAIELPSDFKVVVDGVMIKENDLVFDNIFRPNTVRINPDDPFGYPLSIETSRNISIIGKNGATLEGPNKHRRMFHPHFNEEQDMIGDYWGWRGFLIFITRCDRFRIAGFKFRSIRCWTITLERSKNGHLHDLEFYSYCKNGDGINLRIGCSRIVIENIKGTTSDDMIALNSGGEYCQYPDKQYVFPLVPSNYLIPLGESAEARHIHDVYISNVHSATTDYSEAVAFLSSNGNKIFRVYINGVYDDNPIDKPKRLNIIGAYYVGRYIKDFKVGDISQIRIENVVSNSTEQALMFRHPVTSLSVSGVTQNCKNGVVLLALEKNINTPLPNCKSASGTLSAPAESWVFKP